MSKISSLCAIFAVVALGFLQPTPAQAQLFTTFVSASGSDLDDCSFSTPCATLGQAVSVTSAGGIVYCLDSHDYSQPVTLAASMTIDCSQTTSGIGPFTINGDGVTVTIRGGIIFAHNAPGISFQNGAALIVDKVQIKNNTAGIVFQPSATARILASDCLIHDNSSGPAVEIMPQSGAFANFAIDRTLMQGNLQGVVVDGSSGSVDGVVRDSIISANAQTGIMASGPVSVSLDNVNVAGNSVGVSAGASSGILTRRSFISLNATGISISGGLIFSYGDNSVNANGTGETFSSTIPLK